jgi:hypothetical protein
MIREGLLAELSSFEVEVTWSTRDGISAMKKGKGGLLKGQRDCPGRSEPSPQGRGGCCVHQESIGGLRWLHVHQSL